MPGNLFYCNFAPNFQHMKLFGRSLLFLFFVVLVSSWGFLVHRTVNQLAVYELPKGMQPFFYKNME